MNESQLFALKQRVRETFLSGLSIAIIGWKDSNHSSFTRGLSNRAVLFFDDSPTGLGEKIGYVLFTRFVSHTVINRVKVKKPTHPIVLDTGKIKRILESCDDILNTTSSDSLARDTSKVVEVSVINCPLENHSGGNDLLDFLTQPSKEKSEMSDMEKFIKAFNNNATLTQVSDKKVISSQGLIALLKECDIQMTPQQLIRDGWVEAEAREGAKKAYWYKAGRLMSTHEEKQEKPLPETTAGRVELLLSQEPELKEEKIKLEERLSEIERKLAMIASAKAMFDQLESEFSRK